MGYKRFIVKELNEEYPKVVSYHRGNNEKIGKNFLNDMLNNKYIEVETHRFKDFRYGEIVLWRIENIETNNIECYCVQDNPSSEYYNRFGFEWDGSGKMFTDYAEANKEFLKLIQTKWDQVPFS